MSGGKGNSRANTSSTANNTQTTTNNVDNSVQTSDMGAIAAAFEHGQAALDLGRDSLETAAEFAGRAQDGAFNAVTDVTSQALLNSRDIARDSIAAGDAAIERFANFGDTALQSYEGIAGDALNRVTETSRGVLDFARDLFGDASDAQAKLTDANLAGLTSLAQQTSATSDDRVAKIAMYALIAVAAVFIIPRFFGKAGA